MNPFVVKGLNLSLAGILIVFLILAFIALVVAVISFLDSDWRNREKRKISEALVKPQNIDDLSLVLITAAVATMLKGRHRIRSVSRVKPSSQASVWSIQGRSVLLGSHVISKTHD